MSDEKSAFALELFRQRACDSLEKLSKLLDPRMKLTFIARHPDNPEAEILITDDRLDEIVEVIARRKAAGG